MSLDNRNPFAAWGYDMSLTYKPSENENFTQTFTTPISELENIDDLYNETASVAPFNKTATEVFFRNDENMEEVELQTPAYGYNKDLQITFGGEVVESNDTTEGGEENENPENGEGGDGNENPENGEGGEDNPTEGENGDDETPESENPTESENGIEG